LVVHFNFSWEGEQVFLGFTNFEQVGDFSSRVNVCN
jgi:hypothetical protein